MLEPEFSADGYPTEDTLRAIRTWSYRDKRGVFEFIRKAWTYPERFQESEPGVFEMSTGGWSGNEELVGALKQNHTIWSLCWEESKRGGFHKFRVS